MRRNKEVISYLHKVLEERPVVDVLVLGSALLEEDREELVGGRRGRLVLVVDQDVAVANVLLGGLIADLKKRSNLGKTLNLPRLKLKRMRTNPCLYM